MVENQFKTNIQVIRSDNGLEFVNQESILYFQSKGISHQKSFPYTPQQNGVVERKDKYLLETARALLFQSKLPTMYWGGMYTYSYIYNKHFLLPSFTISVLLLYCIIKSLNILT